jgi:multisubunit Na+/H+ antiporter MnhF subunit
MNSWLWAAAVLVVPLAGLAVVAVRRPVLEGVIALAVMSFAGGIAFVRFLERLR